MAGLERKSFDSPDETRPFQGKRKADIVAIAGRSIGRDEFEPGRRWSQNVKPRPWPGRIRAESRTSATWSPGTCAW
jgi:hypothetical protein